MHMPVLNMLNTRYFITKMNESDSVVVVANREAMGNAWWVGDIKVADNPKEEIESLMEVDLRKTAIVGKDYSDMVPKFAKQYAQVGTQMKEAFAAYRKEVADGTFPAPEHTFKMDETILDKLY